MKNVCRNCGSEDVVIKDNKCIALAVANHLI